MIAALLTAVVQFRSKQFDCVKIDKRPISVGRERRVTAVHISQTSHLCWPQRCWPGTVADAARCRRALQAQLWRHVLVHRRRGGRHQLFAAVALNANCITP